METLYQILGLVGAGFIIWILYRSIRARPDQFSRENLKNSFSTMGILACILILFVAFLVFMVRQSS
jgi:threonine/homoserine/homoserine lactone efflux protein